MRQTHLSCRARSPPQEGVQFDPKRQVLRPLGADSFHCLTEVSDETASLITGGRRPVTQLGEFGNSF